MKLEIENPYENLPSKKFKGNLHMHTENSDGVHPVGALLAFYRSRGYDFVAVTDHSFLTDISRYSRPDFLCINSEETRANHREVVGLNLYETIPDAPSVSAQVSEILKQGGLPIISHPEWAGMSPGELAAVDGYVAIEIYNYICEWLNGKGNSTMHWDYLLSLGKKVWGVAVDDCHKAPEQTEKGWIVAYAEKLEIKDILEAIERGAFYSTQGPEIKEIKVIRTKEEGRRTGVEGAIRDILELSCSPVKVLRFIGSRGMILKEEKGRKVTKGQYVIEGDEKYIRVEVVDRKGKIAWSNPVFIHRER